MADAPKYDEAIAPKALDMGDKSKDAPELTTYEVGNDAEEGLFVDNRDHLHRRLGNRQIQLMAIGGSIGTALFVSINGPLHHGGPGSLLIAYALYSIMLGTVNNCMAEMTVHMPVSGGFIRLAGKWVDDAFGFMAGYNFFIYEALLIPFEITAVTLVLSFWRDDIPAAAVISVCIVLYGLLNLIAVKVFGEAEFWLSSGKAILIFILFCFTFITMVGGNPEHDAYGFRYWRDPGAFAEYRSTGSLGRFEGFLAALWAASFCIVGPEYPSLIAAEAKRPRIYIKNAFKTMYARFAIFYIGSALAVGIVLAYNDRTLVEILSGKKAGGGTAAASPYVIAMQNLRINGLPHLVNALMITSIFSAGNTYTYCSTRSLYGLALEGRAPKFLRKCTKGGVPIYCFAIVMIFPLLSFLALGNGSNVVLGWLLNLITAGGVINYIVMCVTYLAFYRACKVQGLDRNKLPYKGWFQPYCGWIGLGWMTFIVFTYGYSSFKPWSVQNFFIYYTMVIAAPVLYFGWKLVHKTRIVPSAEVDLVWEAPTIDMYEATFVDPPLGFWREVLQMVGLFRGEAGDSHRRSSVVVVESNTTKQ